MWIRKIIEKINRTDCISNKEVLQKVDEKRQLVNLIRERQARWIGHVMRGDPWRKNKIKAADNLTLNNFHAPS